MTGMFQRKKTTLTYTLNLTSKPKSYSVNHKPKKL